MWIHAACRWRKDAPWQREQIYHGEKFIFHDYILFIHLIAYGQLFCCSLAPFSLNCLAKTIYLIKWRRAHNYIVHFLSSIVCTQNMNIVQSVWFLFNMNCVFIVWLMFYDFEQLIDSECQRQFHANIKRHFNRVFVIQLFEENETIQIQSDFRPR